MKSWKEVVLTSFLFKLIAQVEKINLMSYKKSTYFFFYLGKILYKLVCLNLRIYLCRLDVGMAEHLADYFHRNAGTKGNGGGESMTSDVCRYRLFDSYGDGKHLQVAVVDIVCQLG